MYCECCVEISQTCCTTPCIHACLYAYQRYAMPCSVYQMMRGAEMLFAAVFSVTFLHRTLNRLHISGILCCVVSALPWSTIKMLLVRLFRCRVTEYLHCI